MILGLIPLENPVLGLPRGQSAEIRTYIGDGVGAIIDGEAG
jgi:hypothetical protein